MNHLQRAWLKILSPVIPLVNDKLAKRSGLLGKIGKFWAFGPRQFGYHPTSKFLALVNQILLQNIPLAMHRHSFLKNLTQNGYFNQRPYAIPSMFGTILILFVMLWGAVPREFYVEEGTSLEVLADAQIPFHYNALNDRVSAHYTEINSLYHYEMVKRIEERMREVERLRLNHSDKGRKTRFAREGYNYIEPHVRAQL